MSILSFKARSLGFCLGMYLALTAGRDAHARSIQWEAALRVPQLITLGAELRCSETLGEEATAWCNSRLRPYVYGGYFQYPFNSTSTGARLATLEIGERWYFGGVPDRFYLGLGLGYRYIRANANLSAFRIQGENVSSGALLSLHSIYLGPALGVTWGLGEQSRFGLELGVQWAFAGNGALNMIDEAGGRDSTNSETLAVYNASYLNRVARTLLPQVALARFTFSF